MKDREIENIVENIVYYAEEFSQKYNAEERKDIATDMCGIGLNVISWICGKDKMRNAVENTLNGPEYDSHNFMA